VKPANGGVKMNGNLVGGSTAEKENVIEGSGGPAIEIFEAAGEPGSTTEIARNRGSDNAGLFIDLVAGANEGILPPVIDLAEDPTAVGEGFESRVKGTALPGANVRVFRKGSSEEGELAGFLGEVAADGSGNWELKLGSTDLGARVAATQTNSDGATSELAVHLTTIVVVDGGCAFMGNCDDKGGGGNGGGSGGTPDTTAPTVKITKAPKAKSTSTTAKFKFKANEAGSTFQCKLDKAKFKKCKSPKTYKKLKPGKHVFKVRATDKAGNVGKPAKKKFTVLAS
ncbi:MAG TPA: hypothetical protein VFY69_10745, partial [Solirubrobacterales bacterium]|nr:hypothetical protein [Solirubrobacterales bacterium]